MTGIPAASGRKKDTRDSLALPTLSVTSKARLWRARYWIFAGFAALTGQFFVNAAQAEQAQGYQVLAVQQDVTVGQPVATVQLAVTSSATAPPPNAVTDVKLLTNQYFQYSLSSGTVITSDLLSPSPYGDLPHGYVVMPVNLSSAAQVQMLQPGMHVQLLGTLPTAEQEHSAAPSQVIAKTALVLRPGTGHQISAGSGLFDAPASSAEHTVLLGLTQPDALLVATASRWGPIHAVIME